MKTISNPTKKENTSTENNVIESINSSLDRAFVKKFIVKEIKDRDLLIKSEGTRELIRSIMGNYYFHLCNKIEHVAKEIAKKKTVTAEIIQTAYNLLSSKVITKNFKLSQEQINKAFQKRPLTAEIRSRKLLMKSHGTIELINTILYSHLVELVNNIEHVSKHIYKKKTVTVEIIQTANEQMFQQH